MPGVYRIETSANARAGCQNKECKDAGLKIQKGELRFGTFVTIQDHQTWRWKHWGCVTPVQIVHLKDAIENDVNLFDGYDELDKNGQDKISKTIEVGHVADEDWRGDPEVNRPGMKGFRSSATKKKAREEKKAEAEAAEEASPSKPTPKKRGRSKKDADEDEEQEEQPTPKKRKSAVKRTKKVKAEEEEEELQVERPASPPQKNGRKGRKAKNEGSARTKVKQEEDDAEESAIQQHSSKKGRAPRAASRKKVKLEDVDDEEMEDSGSDFEADLKEVDEMSDDPGPIEPTPSSKRGRQKGAKVPPKKGSRKAAAR